MLDRVAPGAVPFRWLGFEPDCYLLSWKRCAKLSRSALFTSETAQNVNPDSDQRKRWYP